VSVCYTLGKPPLFAFFHFLPKPDFIAVITASPEIILARKQELSRAEIEIQYKSGEKIIHTEEWADDEIASIKVDEMPNRSLYNDLIQGDRCLRFRRNDRSDWIYLNSIEGRVIPLSPDNAEELLRFLKNA
jgi:hypothetical protein